MRHQRVISKREDFKMSSLFDLPRAERDSPPRTSWCRPGAAGQTPCHSDTGSGNPGTEKEKKYFKAP
jgi:hypothetical protein